MAPSFDLHRVSQILDLLDNETRFGIRLGLENTGWDDILKLLLNTAEDTIKGILKTLI